MESFQVAFVISYEQIVSNSLNNSDGAWLGSRDHFRLSNPLLSIFIKYEQIPRCGAEDDGCCSCFQLVEEISRY